MSSVEFRKGMRVRLSSLQTASEKNGQEGVLSEWIEGASRWRVNLDGGNIHDLKTKNLKIVDSSVPLSSVQCITVGISDVDTESADGVTYFKVKVELPEAASAYIVRRRYNHFFALKGDLEKAGIPAAVEAPHFPRKHLTGCSGAKLEARKVALDAWLQATLPKANGFRDLPSLWSEFLQRPVP